MAYFWHPDHIAAMLALPLLGLPLCLAARRAPGLWLTVVRVALGLLLIANEVFYVAWELLQGGFTARYSLPLFLCDVAAVVAGVALIRPRPLLAEITWFWALAGTLQGLITPDNDYPYPSYMYWEFYIDHVGVVLAAFLLVVGMRMYPRRGAVARVFAITAAFTAAVAVVDVAAGADYMYLRFAPLDGSLLSLMGPWPWYIVTGTALALVLLIVLDAPFRLIRHRRRAPAGVRARKPADRGLGLGA